MSHYLPDWASQYLPDWANALIDTLVAWAIEPSAVIFLVVVALATVILIFGRKLGQITLYLFLLAGALIFSVDLASRTAHGDWKSAFDEYAPHFASEILITSIAVMLLERMIASRERMHMVRRTALGALRFFVRFCEAKPSIDREEENWLRDELEAFNDRKEKWRALMSREERRLFDIAATAAGALVGEIGTGLQHANGPRVSLRETPEIPARLADLRDAYRNCRRQIWLSSDPDDIF